MGQVRTRSMESAIQISKINDFIFCPRSIYFHGLYENFTEKIYHQLPQVVGKIKHQNIDRRQYSTSKNCLQGLYIYSEKYNLIGKIDIYLIDKETLIERKYKIKKIYDGYRYQLYAQYLCLKEMGYPVKNIFIHSLSDNKRYEIPLPLKTDITKFKSLIKQIQNYQIREGENINLQKCNQCIYREMCK